MNAHKPTQKNASQREEGQLISNCRCRTGNSLAVQGLGLGAFTAVGPGSIPGQGTKIPQATWHSQKNFFNKIRLKKKNKCSTVVKSMGFGASLVVQWLGVRLPMQGTRVQSLVWEDPTCHAWSNWAHGPRLLRLRSGACEPRLLSPHASAAGARAPRACAPQQKPQ